jgi:non-ribosomal peptide synthetase component F
LLLVTTATKSRLPKSLPTIADIATLAQQPVGEVSLETHADPKDPAYIVYTSGSTGFPKGVLIERHAVTNLIYALEQILYVPLGGQVRELLSAPFIFDAAIQQCLSCLVTGNELHILNESSRRDPVQFLRYVREHNIQIAVFTSPSRPRLG